MAVGGHLEYVFVGRHSAFAVVSLFVLGWRCMLPAIVTRTGAVLYLEYMLIMHSTGSGLLLAPMDIRSQNRVCTQSFQLVYIRLPIPI